MSFPTVAPAMPDTVTAAIAAIDWTDKHYLIVDDFVGIRQLLRESLRNLGAKHIDQAASGGEAMIMLAKTHYDVVLCDFNLGEGKNGQQVLEEVRIRNLMTPSSVWLMVSAEKSVESVMGAAEHQPDAYIIKPITEGVLLTRLNRVWQKKQIFREIDQAFVEKDYLRAARLCDEQIVHNKLHEIDLLRMKAQLLLKAGEPEKARVVYDLVLEERDYNWARTGLAKIRMSNGDHEAARQMFQGVIAENRFYIDAYDQLATAYQLMGKVEESCDVLEKAAKLSPNSVPRQRNLGNAALKLGNIPLAERAFRKCIAIGEYSVLKTVDAYFGLARVCGQKNDPKEALQVLATAQREFSGDQVALRAKITEGLVYHESGDYRRARKSGDELETMLNEDPERPDTDTCIEMATLLFAVGVKDAPVELLCYVIRNNHDNQLLLEDVQKIFDKARMSEEGADLIQASRKEAAHDEQGRAAVENRQAGRGGGVDAHRARRAAEQYAHPVQFGADTDLAHAAERLHPGADGRGQRRADARGPHRPRPAALRAADRAAGHADAVAPCRGGGRSRHRNRNPAGGGRRVVEYSSTCFPALQ